MTRKTSALPSPANGETRAPQPRIQVPLCDLGLAPENLRAAEPEDADVPRLAETIRAAGLIYPPIVRKGRKGEARFMVLDGRRRRFALLRLAEAGAIPADHPVECLLAEDRAAQAAAAVLPNAEHAPVHLADVILAIGKLRRTRLSTAQIAEALGYDELEVKRLEAMAHVHEDVLTAFRLGKLTLRQVRLFARIKDRTRQGELVRDALVGYFHEHALQSAVTGGRVIVEDPRFALVSEADYAAAGGRLSGDLFGELPAEVLDPELLDGCWRAAAAALAQPLVEEGLALSFARDRGFAAPDGLAHLPFVHWGSLPDARRAEFDAVRTRLEVAEAALAHPEHDGGGEPDPAAREAARSEAVAELMRARLALARLTAGRGEVVMALLTPVRGGLDLTFYHRPPTVEEIEADADAEYGDGDGDEDDQHEGDDGGDRRSDMCGAASSRAARRRREIEPVEVVVEVAGVSHAQHAARTVLASRGLIRDLADAPEAAMVVLTAHLFAELAQNDPRTSDESLLGVRATAGVRTPPEAGLDGEVWGRLAAWRELYLESGGRPIGWVASLEPEARGRLLAELVAVTVDLREPRTDRLRRGARAEAEELAALCSADLGARWTPDAAFLELHSRPQLLAFLAEMEASPDKAAAMKKPELVQATVEAAAARRWIPDCLRWAHPSAASEAADAGGGGDAGSETAAEDVEMEAGSAVAPEPDRQSDAEAA